MSLSLRGYKMWLEKIEKLFCLQEISDRTVFLPIWNVCNQEVHVV